MEIRPQAMAIPAETDHLDKGKSRPISPRHRPATASRSWPRSSRTRIRFMNTRRTSRRPSKPNPTFWRRSNCTICAGCCSRSMATRTSSARRFRYRLRQVPPKTPWPFLALPASGRLFENLEGFPMDWQTNPEGFVRFVRAHQVPSFLEYGEYPFVSADEIKKALTVKSALTEMLDQLQ